MDSIIGNNDSDGCNQLSMVANLNDHKGFKHEDCDDILGTNDSFKIQVEENCTEDGSHFGSLSCNEANSTTSNGAHPGPVFEEEGDLEVGNLDPTAQQMLLAMVANANLLCQQQNQKFKHNESPVNSISDASNFRRKRVYNDAKQHGSSKNGRKGSALTALDVEPSLNLQEMANKDIESCSAQNWQWQMIQMQKQMLENQNQLLERFQYASPSSIQNGDDQQKLSTPPSPPVSGCLRKDLDRTEHHDKELSLGFLLQTVCDKLDALNGTLLMMVDAIGGKRRPEKS